MKITAEKRTQTGTSASKKARAAGKLPAVVYGSKVDSTAILLDLKDVEDTLREVGLNGVFEIDLEGESLQVFVKEAVYETFRPQLRHIDLLAFTAGEKVTMSIPVYIAGEDAIEVGYVSQSISEIEMDIVPADAPTELTVDVTGMEIGDSLTVAEIEVPEDAEIITEADATVLSISAPDDISDDLEPVEDGADAEMPEPEVINEKDDEEEAEE
ncbi:MAG TPA: 50S ribosomal protein L25 [Alloiococcus sp.]|nr:50S ribosomal protein L25 [Alloiococcus sp.]